MQHLQHLPQPLLAQATQDRRKLDGEILEIARDVLGSPNVKLEDSFFDEGGHSLLATRLVMKIRSRFGVKLKLRDVFEADTIEGLAAKIDCLTSEANSLRTVAERPQALLPAGIAQLRAGDGGVTVFWCHYENLMLANAFNPSFGIYSVGLTIEECESAGPTPTLRTLAGYCVDKIRRSQPNSPYVVGGFSLGGILAYEIACQLESAGHVVRQLILLDTPSPSCFRDENVMAPRLHDVGYLMKRARELSLRDIGRKAAKRFLPRWSGAPDPDSSTLARRQQNLLEIAASAFYADEYRGATLLLLADGNAPHLNFSEEWKQFLVGDAQMITYHGHHDDIGKPGTAALVAAAIESRLLSS